jgi:hypothetical protein
LVSPPAPGTSIREVDEDAADDAIDSVMRIETPQPRRYRTMGLTGRANGAARLKGQVYRSAMSKPACLLRRLA